MKAAFFAITLGAALAAAQSSADLMSQIPSCAVSTTLLFKREYSQLTVH
jgi:hypothetical protein